MSERELIELHGAVRADPQNAQLRYLFGAQLAQAGRYDEAAAEIGNALALQPELHVARFQLGLLYLTMADAARAIEVWGPLERLSNDAALKHFKHGLEALIRDEFAACIAHLERGMALNTSNPPLNTDMSLIIDKAREALQAGAAAQPAQPEQTSGEDVRTDFSLYSKTLN